jgi:Cellulose binding domain
MDRRNNTENFVSPKTGALATVESKASAPDHRSCSALAIGVVAETEPGGGGTGGRSQLGAKTGNQARVRTGTEIGGARLVETRRNRQRFTAAAIACATFCGIGLGLVGTASPSAAVASPSIYVDTYGASWSNASWGSTTNPGSASPVQSGASAISAQVESAWGAVSFRTTEPLATTPTTVISFWVHGGASGTSLQLFTGNDDSFSRISNIIPVNAPANTWTYFGFSAADLGNPRTIARIGIGGWRGSTTELFSIDNVAITNGAPPPTVTVPVTSTIPPAANDGVITLDPATLTPFSSRMWGSNMGAYAGPSGYADPTLRARAAGKVGLIRYPGGQVSQDLGWASCQLQTPVPNAVDCTEVRRNPTTNVITTTRLDWLAKPSDFIGFAKSIQAEAVVSVNINATAKENAAYVAFMNGSPTDTRTIGVDQKGADWKTVGYWAQKRVDAGQLSPLGATLWEFGNETYGGIAGNSRCLSYGWEVTFSCDPTEVLNGLGTGAARFDGYRATKAAMTAVDPTIQLGIPAVDPKESYNNWTADLLRAGGADIDFLELHPYFSFIPPANTDAGNAEILAYPQTVFSGLEARMNSIMDSQAGRRIPMLLSEYNLTPVPAMDPAQRISKVISALIMADSVGAFGKRTGFLGANQFDLYGTNNPDNSYFSQIRRNDHYIRNPQYWSSVLWSRFGGQFATSTSTYDPAATMSVYTGRNADGTLSVLAINKTGVTKRPAIKVAGSGVASMTADMAVGTSLLDTTMTFNGVADPNDSLSNAPSLPIAVFNSFAAEVAIPPYSMVLLHITQGTAPATSSTTTTAPSQSTTPTTPTPTTPVTVPPRNLSPAVACRVMYRKTWDTGLAFAAILTVTNLGPALNDWDLTWDVPSSQRVNNSWNASVGQSQNRLSLTPDPSIRSLATNQSVVLGYDSSDRGTRVMPVFSLNTTACQAG